MTTATELASNETPYESPVIRQMITQLRAMDSYGTYDTWSDERVLSPVILTKEQRREIPVIGDPDETTISRLKAYYNAIATVIEQECSLMAVPMINITHEGFGRAVISVGKLIVVDKTLRDVHRFGFESAEKLIAEVEKIKASALKLVTTFPDVAEL
ncbi:NifX-associated nitrogen fixation protein [Thalassolituus oleivorans]|uniref:NifX-associated nitrogen fixation protein n=1 Tax=Thalassolituus oleivorans TaxID=187493 RepID=UPI0023F1C9A3|nr:NifX-associated nitrogen fixation protein [Thalassolituus oleivorans]|tara:strand:- start:34797 stop:35267 length:471 start_codon:yes stop_codon:yes gene_type:complete